MKIFINITNKKRFVLLLKYRNLYIMLCIFCVLFTLLYIQFFQKNEKSMLFIMIIIINQNVNIKSIGIANTPLSRRRKTNITPLYYFLFPVDPLAQARATTYNVTLIETLYFICVALQSLFSFSILHAIKILLIRR